MQLNRIRWKTSVISVLILLVACKPVAQEQADGNSQTVPDTGNVEFRLKKLSDDITANPQNADLLVQRARIYDRKGATSTALEDLLNAVSIDSTRSDYYLYMADVAFRGLHVQQSVYAFRKAIALDPKNLEANLKFAELNLYLKAYPDALKYSNEALKINERHWKPYFIKGFVYKEMKDTAKAVSSFQTVVEIDPEQYDAYIQLGNIFSSKSNPLALQYYNNALRLRPKSTEALYNRALFFQNTGGLEQAEADYNSILKIDANYADAYYNLGYIELVYRKNYRKAINYFTDVIRVSPDYTEAFYNRGMAFKLSGDKASARKDFQQALKLFPGYKLAQERLVEVGG